jgi:hypothetical protein
VRSDLSASNGVTRPANADGLSEAIERVIENYYTVKGPARSIVDVLTEFVIEREREKHIGEVHPTWRASSLIVGILIAKYKRG